MKNSALHAEVSSSDDHETANDEARLIRCADVPGWYPRLVRPCLGRKPAALELSFRQNVLRGRESDRHRAASYAMIAQRPVVVPT